MTYCVNPNIPNSVIRCLETDTWFNIYYAHDLQFLLLQVNKPLGNRGFFLFKESNLKDCVVVLVDKTACVSPKISLIASFGHYFSL